MQHFGAGARFRLAFPEIVAALAAVPFSATLNCELVVSTAEGRLDVEELRRRALPQRPRRIAAAAALTSGVLVVFNNLTRVSAPGSDVLPSCGVMPGRYGERCTGESSRPIRNISGRRRNRRRTRSSSTSTRPDDGGCGPFISTCIKSPVGGSIRCGKGSQSSGRTKLRTYMGPTRAAETT